MYMIDYVLAASPNHRYVQPLGETSFVVDAATGNVYLTALAA
jgi:hypothetical protein